jgi:hypothetical protein
MIISFNPSIFQSLDSEIQDTLAKILVVLMQTNIHFIDIKSINAIFYNENGEYIFDSNRISKTHLSANQRIILKDFLSKKSRINITNLHKSHLVYITIGLDESNNEIHPKRVYKIITERSKIIVENGINDWKFIQGICQKYSSSKTKRKSIYQLVDRAIKDGIIESENCGGVGEITKVTQRWINDNRYKDIFRYKLMAIFDSDREKANELTRNKSKIEYFKSRKIYNINDCSYEPIDLIVWHILYKRKIENYIPLNVLFTCLTSITPAQKDNLNAKSYEELDFLEYEKNNIGIGKTQIKEQFPQMFLSSFSYHDFEIKCQHHKVFLAEANESISEIEQILLKIAKIL